MIKLGLTGSIGTGKSTTAGFFRDAGIPVYDSDAAVHDLYRGAAVEPVNARFPGVAVDGAIDRKKLSEHVIGVPAAMRDLEEIVHPLVRDAENIFLEKARAHSARLVVLDIPLLFETGADARVDRILVVTAPATVQRDRVMSRPGMTDDKFQAILDRQTPDAEKRARADFIIDTSLGFDHARGAVGMIIAELNGEAVGNTS